MALTILQPSLAATVASSTNQQALRDAIVAAFAGGNVEARYFSGATLAQTSVYGAPVPDSSSPRGFTLGSMVSSVVNAPGLTITHAVYRNQAGVDVYRRDASDLVLAAGSTQAGRRVNESDPVAGRSRVTADPTLPLVPPGPVPLTLSLTSSGVAGSPISGTISNSGESAAPFTLSASPAATLSPASGSVPAGGSVSFTLTAPDSDAYVVSLVNGSGGAVVGSPATTSVSAIPPGPTVDIATLVAYSATSGSAPYSATLLPLRGQVPAGYAINSPDDATLRGSVLATHSDGSASVVVASGTASVAGGVAANIRIRVAAETPETALTAAAISALVTNVTVNFAGSYGSASLTNFASPERVWWANPRTICARYRLPAPTPGSTKLEAVIDIHAWSDRALVEVVVENCKVDAPSGAPGYPAAATYTGATVSINGSTVATVNSTGPASAEGTHAAFRAWYASGWVGANPGLRVTQLHGQLQNNPLFFKIARAATADMSTYASDAYSPWWTGRHRGTNMGGTGDHPSIGFLPQWEARALQSGDHRAWRAVEASTLAALSFNINYRDQGTGLVPTYSQVGQKAMTGSPVGVVWPSQTNGNDAAMWELAHHPACGLMGFVSRPSPVFIEVAQKNALWCGSWTGFGNASGQAGWQWYAGVFGLYSQTRGRAWGIRTQAHAIAVTPDSMAWKADAMTALQRNTELLNAWIGHPYAKTNITYIETPSAPYSVEPSAGFWVKSWQHHYTIQAVHMAASSRLLRGANQALLNTVADWLCLYPIRWINEQPNGGWRYIAYHMRVGNSATTIDSADTWAQIMSFMAGAPTATPGPMYSFDGPGSNYANFAPRITYSVAYTDYFWAALCCAVERNLPGGSAAWNTAVTGVSNLVSWQDNIGVEPRWGYQPRNV